MKREWWRMAKFALVGGLNTGVDFAVFVLLVYAFAMPPAGAQPISYACGVLNSYWWNRKWTFRSSSRAHAAEMVRFAAVNGLSFLAASAVLVGLGQGAGWSPLTAKLASIAASLAVNYAGSRWWVFREARQRHPLP